MNLNPTVLAVLCTATVAVTAAETVVPLEDFLRPNYESSTGRGEVKGMTVAGTLADGTPVMEVRFDFTETPSRDNSFVRTHINKSIPGKPLQATLRFVNPNAEAVPFSLFMTDRSGEVYLTRMVVEPGAGEITLPVAAAPAWNSGDGNGKVDLPMQLEFTMLEQPENLKTGALQVLDCDFTIDVNADTGVGMRIVGTEYNFGTNDVPLTIEVLPFSDEIAADYRLDIRIADTFSGEEVFSVSDEFSLPSDEDALVFPVKHRLPYGSYSVSAEVVNTANNASVAGRNFGVRVFTASCADYASDAEKNYEYRWGVVGGCHDSTTPAESEALGRRWFRFEMPNWLDVETAPGVYNTQVIKDAAEPWVRHNVRPQTLQTLYHYPKFYDPRDLAAFSKGYGRYLQAMAKAMEGVIEEHELGNEDNGANKHLYTEVARNGAAGIRASQPFAVIGNSGTAHVDYGWLEIQGERRLFDTLDALVVHPYTNNSTCTEAASPEKFQTTYQLERLYELAFRFGGMKELWHTEVGWPNGEAENERHRTNLYVRMMIAGDVAGVRNQVVYNWDRDYNTAHYASGVALHNFTKRRMGTRFVGLMHDEGKELYTAVYEGAGKPFAIQWTTAEGEFAPTVTGRYSDMFGNPAAEIQVSRSPIYIDELDNGVVLQAAQAQAEKYAGRFQKFLADHPSANFSGFAAIAPVETAKLRQALLQFLNQTDKEISVLDQALFSFALDWYLQTARYYPAGKAEMAFDPTELKAFVAEEHERGIDAASVRYLLRVADKVAGQQAMAEGNAAYQAECAAELALIQRAAEVFAQYGQHVQFAAFTALYMEHEGALVETLYFIPTLPTTVRFRVSNYSEEAQTATVSPLLPEGWSAETPEVTVQVPANGEAWGELVLTAPSNAKDTKLSVTTRIDGKPDRVTTFNRLEYIPAVNVSVPLLSERPGVLPVTVANKEANPVSGSVCLLPGAVAGGPLAQVDFTIPGNSEKLFELPLSEEAARRLAQAGYVLDAQVSLSDGRRFDAANIDADFGAAVRMPADTVIDGDLAKWNGALPLKVNKAEYTYGTYGNSWSPGDLSATTYLGWNDQNFYFAGVVTDQVIGQPEVGDAMWQRDSIQLLFVADANDSIHEFTIALSHDGPVVWDQTLGRRVEEAQVFVSYEYGRFVYELALPWTVLGPQYAEALKRGTLGYAIAINDDDVLVPRRCMERFFDTVLHHKNVENFAPIHLLKTAPTPLESSANTIYFDDFENHAVGKLPASYDHVHNNLPQDVTQIAAGRGEAGGKVLEMKNSVGAKPNHFCVVTSEMRTEPGRKYRLTARVKGIGDNVIGVCSDLWGNQDFSYIALPKGNEGWYTVNLDFTAGATGRQRLIFRNDSAIEEFLIDEAKVEKLP